MSLYIGRDSCYETEELAQDEIAIDRGRINFILKRRIRGLAGRRRLGAVWLILHPILLSLVYLFVFTVIRSNPNSVNLFIGISMFNIFSSSIKSGVNSVRDFTGGIKAERVRTRVVTNSMIRYRFVDVLLQTAGVSVILILALNVNISGVLCFILLSLLMSVLAEGFALNVSLLVRRVPDFSNIIDYILMLMFFGSPVLYPMSLTEGLHYKINEYNPFAFFVESARHFAEIDSVISAIWGYEAWIILGLLVILSIRGYSTLDKLRWEVSAWS